MAFCNDSECPRAAYDIVSEVLFEAAGWIRVLWTKRFGERRQDHRRIDGEALRDGIEETPAPEGPGVV